MKKSKPLTEAQQKLVADNLPMALDYCKKWPIMGMDADDNKSEAFFCLTKAAKNFDPAKGFRFSTFAWKYWWNHRKDACREKELAARGFGVAHVAYHDDNQKLFDPADNQPGPEQIVDSRDELDDKLKKIEFLDLRSRFVLTKRMSGASFESIGKELGVSKQRAQQIEAYSIFRIKHRYVENGSLKNLTEISRKKINGYQRKAPAIRQAMRVFPCYTVNEIAIFVGCSAKIVQKYFEKKKKFKCT